MFKPIVALISCSVISLLPSLAEACPKVGGLPDLNCNGEAKVVVLGDSLVYGIGDIDNGNKGGYVMRTARVFPKAKFVNLGLGGRRVTRTIDDLQAAFAGTEDTTMAKNLVESDVIFLDFGRNDWWDRKPALVTWRNLKRCRDIITTYVMKTTGHKPLIITAQMTLANRTGQGTWVAELNTLLAQKATAAAPADLRFNALSKRLLGDQVHPTSQGYQELARIFSAYLTTSLPKHVSTFRKDSDGDGLYDEYE